jgi:hypothetical protein
VGTVHDPDGLKRIRFYLLERTCTAWKNEVTEKDDKATLKKLEEGELLPHIRLHDLRHLHVKHEPEDTKHTQAPSGKEQRFLSYARAHRSVVIGSWLEVSKSGLKEF